MLSLSCLVLACACAEGDIAYDIDSGDAGPIAAEAEALLAGKQTVEQVMTLVPTAPVKDIELRKWWEPTAPLLRRIPRKAVVVLGAAKPKRGTAEASYWYQVVHAGTWVGFGPASSKPFTARTRRSRSSGAMRSSWLEARWAFRTGGATRAGYGAVPPRGPSATKVAARESAALATVASMKRRRPVPPSTARTARGSSRV